MREPVMAAGGIDQARAVLEQAAALAVSARPEALDAGHGLLERAAGLLEQALLAARTQPNEAGPGAREALARFTKELKKVAGLHEHANAFHVGWMRLLDEFSGAGYSPRSGETLAALAAAYASRRRVSLVA